MTSESLVMTSGSLVMTSDLHVISLVTFMTCHFTCQVPLDRVVKAAGGGGEGKPRCQGWGGGGGQGGVIVRGGLRSETNEVQQKNTARRLFAWGGAAVCLVCFLDHLLMWSSNH